MPAFLTRDPIGYSGGINLYAYCEMDPVNFGDPDSLRGIRFGRIHLFDDGNPWLDFHGNDFDETLAATADGLNPFGNPLAEMGYYDKCDGYNKFSVGAAMVGSGLLGLAGGSALGASSGAGTVCWSGGGGVEASAWAAENGARTVTMTQAGRVLEAIDDVAKTVVPWALREPVWKLVSANFALNSSQVVHVFLRDPRATAIWFTVEQPILEALGRTIVYH